jgi:hypothetical protein
MTLNVLKYHALEHFPGRCITRGVIAGLDPAIHHTTENLAPSLRGTLATKQSSLVA